MTDVLHTPLATELFASAIPARFAYTGLDGDPYVVPVAFHWTGKTVIVCTVERSAEVAAIRANPRVALTIDTEGFPATVLPVRGAVAVETVEGVPDEATLPDFETTIPKAAADLVAAAR
ncbi:pyridoxamine 5'-phosphate oxidase family protein [Pseudonocardia xishanensis]|uniref:Pyridoxamine 5'-phosphate oxidase N-terminal domain-containing protein n=1 Tax=Pseudonocardia xishanensis TaxID=630995 RepID=A0ABP8RRD7_9PSEU